MQNPIRLGSEFVILRQQERNHVINLLEELPVDVIASESRKLPIVIISGVNYNQRREIYLCVNGPEKLELDIRDSGLVTALKGRRKLGFSHSYHWKNGANDSRNGNLITYDFIIRNGS